jgi:hypothetical protein
MTTDRDDLFAESSGHATATVLGLLKNSDCTLIDLTFTRADGGDWMSTRFTRARYPGRVFTFRRGFFHEGPILGCRRTPQPAC